MRRVVRGRPALTPALPKPTSSAQRRRRRPSISNASRPEICRTRSTSLGSANSRSRVDHPAGSSDGQIRVGRAQRDAQVGDRLADPDVGRLASRAAATDSDVPSAWTSHVPPPVPEMLTRTVGVAGGRALAGRRERFRQPAFE